jgi:imidazolonepropionase-like amidohydrolase
MKAIPHLLLVLVAMLAGACASTSPVTAIVGATVIDPRQDGDAAVAQAQTILIRDSRILAVGDTDSVRVPDGATYVNARGKYVVPGLIDAHVHFFQSGNLYTRPDAADFNAVVPYAKEDQRNRARLPATFKVWLASGVTSVVDVGGPFWNFEARDLAAHTAAAPRVAVAGPLISMVDRVKLDLGDPPIIKITSPGEARALVKRELAGKPDYIKVWYIHQKGDDLAAQEAIVKAAADAAHEAGIKLAVHATELLVAKSALEAGADYLVHSVEDEPVDDEFIALAKRNKAIYCPTLFVIMGYRYALSGTWKPTPEEKRLADPDILAAMDDLAKIPKAKMPPRVAALVANPPTPKVSEVALANLRRVWDAGIPVAMGTDAGNIGTLHGPSIFREMELMTHAGLTPLQVLRSATVNGARAFGRGDELGVVAPGRLADLVILDGNPVTSVRNLSTAWRVMKDGRLYDPYELMRSIGAR